MSVKEELHSMVEALPEYQATWVLEELRKLQELLAAIDHSDEQLARGEYTEYDENTILDLAEDVKRRGMARLAKEHKNGNR